MVWEEAGRVDLVQPCHTLSPDSCQRRYFHFEAPCGDEGSCSEVEVVGIGGVRYVQVQETWLAEH